MVGILETTIPMDSCDDLSRLRLLSESLKNAQISSIRGARTSDPEQLVHSIYVIFDDGRTLYFGEYAHLDPPKLIDASEAADLENFTDDYLLPIIGRSVVGMFLDKLERVFLALDGNILIWAAFGEVEMFLGLDDEPAERHGYIADLTPL